MYYENEAFDKPEIENWDAPFDNDLPNQNPQITSEHKINFAVSQDSEGNFFTLGPETRRKVESWYGFDERAVLENEAAKGFFNAIKNPQLDPVLLKSGKVQVGDETVEFKPAVEEFVPYRIYNEDEEDSEGELITEPDAIIYPRIVDLWEGEIGVATTWDDLNKTGEDK